MKSVGVRSDHHVVVVPVMRQIRLLLLLVQTTLLVMSIYLVDLPCCGPRTIALAVTAMPPWMEVRGAGVGLEGGASSCISYSS